MCNSWNDNEVFKKTKEKSKLFDFFAKRSMYTEGGDGPEKTSEYEMIPEYVKDYVSLNKFMLI